jgi:hypothetical protein
MHEVSPLQLLPGSLHPVVEPGRGRAGEGDDVSPGVSGTCRTPALCQLLDDVGFVSFEMATVATLCFEGAPCE